MKKKLLILPIIALMALTACNPSSGQQGGTEPSGEPQTVSKALDFIKESGMARIDIRTTGLGVTFNYGDSSEIKTDSIGGYYVTIRSGSKLTVTGTLATESVNFVVVDEKNDGATSCSIYKAILKDSLNEFLSDFAKTHFDGSKKSYVAISAGKNIDWNKNESQLLNELIERYANAL